MATFQLNSRNPFETCRGACTVQRSLNMNQQSPESVGDNLFSCPCSSSSNENYDQYRKQLVLFWIELSVEYPIILWKVQKSTGRRLKVESIKLIRMLSCSIYTHPTKGRRCNEINRPHWGEIMTRSCNDIYRTHWGESKSVAVLLVALWVWCKSVWLYWSSAEEYYKVLHYSGNIFQDAPECTREDHTVPPTVCHNAPQGTTMNHRAPRMDASLFSFPQAKHWGLKYWRRSNWQLLWALTMNTFTVLMQCTQVVSPDYFLSLVCLHTCICLLLVQNSKVVCSRFQAYK